MFVSMNYFVCATNSSFSVNLCGFSICIHTCECGVSILVLAICNNCAMSVNLHEPPNKFEELWVDRRPLSAKLLRNNRDATRKYEADENDLLDVQLTLHVQLLLDLLDGELGHLVRGGDFVWQQVTGGVSTSCIDASAV